LRISEMIGFRDGIAWSLYELADAQRDAGLYQEAQENLERGLAIYRQLGSLDAALCLYRLGYLLILQGQTTQAGPFLAESLDAYRQVGSKDGLAITHCFQGELALAIGDEKSAVTNFKRSLALFRTLSEEGNPWGSMRALDGLSRTYLAMGRLDATCTTLSDLLDRARRLNSLPSLMNSLIGLAGVLARQGQDLQAVDLLAVPLVQIATRHESRRRAQRLLEQLQARVPAETLHNQLRAGEKLAPWELFDQGLLPLAMKISESAE
jgi:tetratricopeptide (TPR) repeat protein